MSDKDLHFAPCHVSSQPAPCRCCSDHRVRIGHLLAELDAERAAAAIGASDWTDMIRRLQREKSDAMLESKHLKRVSEDQKEQISRLRSEKEALEEALRKNEERISSLLNEVEERKKVFDDLPQWVKHTMRLKKEEEEKEHEKKRKAEAHLYTIIKLARDEDLCKQIGKDIYFDLVDHDKVHSFHIQKQLSFTAFKEKVAQEFGILVQFQRYWLWAKRQNHTYRPFRPLTALEELQTTQTVKRYTSNNLRTSEPQQDRIAGGRGHLVVSCSRFRPWLVLRGLKTYRHHLFVLVGTLSKVSEKKCNAELKLFLEVELGLDLRPLPPPDNPGKYILIFFKLYVPEKEELRYVGRMFVKADGKPLEILAKLNELAGFPENEKLDLFEEIKFQPNIMCVLIDERLSFCGSQIENGDIICFQKATVSETETNYRFPDVPSFLESVHEHQVQLSRTGTR